MFGLRHTPILYISIIALGLLCPDLVRSYSMTLREYVISYQKDGKIVANLFDYYEIYIKPLDKRFDSYSYYKDKLVLCYFRDHADVNPSMGYIRHRKFKGVTVCHCLGCGKTADVVRLHQILAKQYHGLDLTECVACLAIAELFSIPIDDEVIGEEDYEKAYVRDIRKLGVLSNRYTIREYNQTLLDIRDRKSVV